MLLASSSSCILQNHIMIIFTFLLRTCFILAIISYSTYTLLAAYIMLPTFEWRRLQWQRKVDSAFLHWNFVCLWCIKWDEFDKIWMYATKIEPTMIIKSICHINYLKHWIPKMFYTRLASYNVASCSGKYIKHKNGSKLH